MRLIDADEVLTKQYCIDDSATLSTREVVNVEDIEDAPTVQAVPIEVLDEIDEQKEIMTDIQGDSYYTIRMGELRSIIDKYRKGESE